MLFKEVTMNPKIEKTRGELTSCQEEAMKIIEGLDVEDIRKKLSAIAQIEQLSNVSCDDEIRELKEYRSLKGTLKDLHIAIARSIMDILSSEASFSGDAESSFNYTEPLDEMLAAEYIKLLPNAYIAGPMKTAIKSPHLKVIEIAIDHYDSLPSDVKYSGLFPDDFKQVVRAIKTKIKN